MTSSSRALLTFHSSSCQQEDAAYVSGRQLHTKLRASHQKKHIAAYAVAVQWAPEPQQLLSKKSSREVSFHTKMGRKILKAKSKFQLF